MLSSEYLRAPLDPVGAMIIMHIDYKVYRELVDHGYLGYISGTKQFLLSALNYHSFWDIVLCEARIHFNNFTQADEGHVDHIINEIAFEIEDTESESWDDFFINMSMGFPFDFLMQRPSLSTFDVGIIVYQIFLDVAKSFMSYLNMLQNRVIDSEVVFGFRPIPDNGVRGGAAL